MSPPSAPPCRLHRFPCPDDLAGAVAGRWLARLEPGRAGQPFAVALSGGRIAQTFLEAAAQKAGGRDRLWQNVHFFWADERCVPPDHPESNYGLASRALLNLAPVPPRHLHRIRGELDPREAASAAEEELRRVVPAPNSGEPVLDLVFLGMGEDGHVASLFPGEPHAAESDPALYRPVIASKPPPSRVTMGYGLLAAAREVWVLVSGPGKTPALLESMRVDGGTPLARLLRLRRGTEIFTDCPLPS